MNGLEVSKAFYEQHGRPMLEKQFPDLCPRIAVGLVGHGSECFGYDDVLSEDHDFEPGFCLWLTDEDFQNYEFSLFRAYQSLPKEFMGKSIQAKSGLGSHCKGVQSISEFYHFYIGDTLPKSNEDWLYIPDFYLAEATNGEVFVDFLGDFSEIRRYLKTEQPQDVWLKKLGSDLFHAGQYGQYNYKRCMLHGEKTAAATALAHFCEHIAKIIYQLEHKYAPYYKWLYRGLIEMEAGKYIAPLLSNLMEHPYELETNEILIETICQKIQQLLSQKELTNSKDSYLVTHSEELQNLIEDPHLRNQSIML